MKNRLLIVSTLLIAFESLEQIQSPSLEISERICDIETDATEFISTDYLEDGCNWNYHCIDEYPEYPGGPNAFRSFFIQHFIYPEITDHRKIVGKCHISFGVDTDGSIHSITLIRGVPNCPECDAEAIRIISLMPKWKANSLTHRIVQSSYNLTIAFNLK